MTDKEEIERLRACNETLRRIVFEYRARAREVAQDAPDPDAWMRDDGSAATINPMTAAQWKAHGGHAIPLYTHPPIAAQSPPSRQENDDVFPGFRGNNDSG
jgi:hypothetical protein